MTEFEFADIFCAIVEHPSKKDVARFEADWYKGPDYVKFYARGKKYEYSVIVPEVEYSDSDKLFIYILENGVIITKIVEVCNDVTVEGEKISYKTIYKDLYGTDDSWGKILGG